MKKVFRITKEAGIITKYRETAKDIDGMKEMIKGIESAICRAWEDIVNLKDFAVKNSKLSLCCIDGAKINQNGIYCSKCDSYYPVNEIIEMDVKEWQEGGDDVKEWN